MELELTLYEDMFSKICVTYLWNSKENKRGSDVEAWYNKYINLIEKMLKTYYIVLKSLSLEDLNLY